MTEKRHDKDCEYHMKLSMTLYYIHPPEDVPEKIERAALQTTIDAHFDKWMSDPRNRQNLINAILGNTGLLARPRMNEDKAND